MSFWGFVELASNWRTEFIFRETIQLHRLRDFVRLAANDDRH